MLAWGMVALGGWQVRAAEEVQQSFVFSGETMSVSNLYQQLVCYAHLMLMYMYAFNTVWSSDLVTSLVK